MKENVTRPYLQRTFVSMMMTPILVVVGGGWFDW